MSAILVYGLLTGVIFGFLLQRARVIRYDKQLGALRLIDMTIVKFMLSSVLVAMVGVYLLKDLGLVKLSIKPLILGMIAGAALYAEAYPLMKSTVLTWGDYGKVTLPQLLGVNHWIVIAAFVAGGVGLLRWFEKKGL